MTKVAQLVRNEKFPLVFSVLTAVSGLALRTCHGADTGYILPMCGDSSAFLGAGQSAALHCAGCYVAVAGLVSAFASTIFMARARK
ncbi:MAG: hypothetical protein CBB65_03980 [Hyphomonadaceae bacterium TMED5]|nr:hypothetical protein [Ponticaulis sp.]OUY00602.1 MAG: hypothetical protein CBB65_03980 [Hyphomonadaceae bacterium TMED5]